MKLLQKAKYNVAILPLILLLFVMLIAFIIGGVALMYQGAIRYVYGAIAGLPFLFFSKKVKKGLATKKK